MARVEEVFGFVASKFGISSLNTHQKNAIKKIVEEKKDVFVNLPTGFGKSLIFQALPLVFDQTTQESGHIVVVVSPLVSLMDEQVSKLKGLGVSAVNMSSHEEEERSSIENGEYSVVYGSPEAWLKNERWRSMLSNTVYSRKLCAIAVNEAHVVRQW
jgi:superfamily II DNA helicase RecQ